MTARALLLCCTLACSSFLAHAQDVPKTIYSYAVGNWRSGPVVFISPLIETTEQATTAQLIDRLRKDHVEFKDITDIDVQRFATAEEGNESRMTLRSKYLVRKLEVRMLTTPAK